MELKPVDFKHANQVGAISHTWELLVASTNVDVAARDDSGWRDIRPHSKATIDVFGIIGDTVKLYGTNKPNPQAGDPGTQIGDDITEDGLVVLTDVYAYLRLKHTGNGTGSVNAYLYATAP